MSTGLVAVVPAAAPTTALTNSSNGARPDRMPKGLIANIQYLRAFAALAVVVVHATSRDGLQTSLSFGKFGVDVFFVISGFIMCQITASDSSHFFVKRVIRIVPSYW